MTDLKKKLTVDRIYNEPNLSGKSITSIDWSPNGKTLSYILGTEKGRELWGFDVTGNKRRLLFDFARLRKRNKMGLKRKSGKAGTRDSHANRVPPIENLSYSWMPDSTGILVSATAQMPCILNLDSNKLEPISKVAQPIRNTRVSPNGQFISFVRAWDLYMVDLTTASEYALTIGSSEIVRTSTPDTMGDLLTDSGHWWSPDSSQVAYLQCDERAVPTFWISNLMSSRGINDPERFPQPGDPIPTIVLKVVSTQGQLMIDTRPWIGWYLARVCWLPDSRHLALQMLNREQNQLCLVLADSHTGTTRTLLKETDPCWINVVNDMRFFADSSKFLWSSERDSYRHLYLYDINGKELLQLTSGTEACVAVEGMDEANGAVYYLVWPDPYTEAHLKRVTFDVKDGKYTAGRPTLLTAGGASHFAHLSPDHKYFGDIHSTAINPPLLDLHSASDGSLVATVEDNPCQSLESYGLRPFEFVSLPAARLGIPSDDMPLPAKLLEPEGLKKGEKYPVIVYIYGGPLPGGFGLARNVLDYWRPVPELWLQMMAQKGFGVFSLDNRGSNAAPRGHDWETPIHRRLGHVELADQLEGIKYLKNLEWVDPQRIGIVGGSFGGFMTLNAMIRTKGIFRSGVCYAPVTNWRQYDCVYTERYMDLPDQNPEGYDETAISQYAADFDNQKSKLLMIHGANDPNVHLQHSIQLVDRLVVNSKRFRIMLYPNQVHMSFFGMGQSPARLWNHITTFMVNTLREKSQRRVA